MLKRKIKVLSLSDKLKIVNAFESGKSRNEIQSEFGLPESTFYKIIKSKDCIKSQCSEGHGNIKRSRLSVFPDIEKCLLEWIKQTLDKNIPIDGPLLKQKAKDFATKLEIQNFSASNGWLEGFKKRQNIAFKKAAGESKSVDQGICNQWTEDLPNLLEGFPKDDGLLEQWLSFCEIPESVLSSATRLCSDHFKEDDFIHRLNRVVLKPGVIPSVFSKKNSKRRKLENQSQATDEQMTQIAPLNIENSSTTFISSPSPQSDIAGNEFKNLSQISYIKSKVLNMAKTNAEKCREYKLRKKAAKEAEAKQRGIPVKKTLTSTERSRKCREKKKLKTMVNQDSSSFSALLNPDICTVIVGQSVQLFSGVDNVNDTQSFVVSNSTVDQIDKNTCVPSSSTMVVQAEMRKENSQELHGHHSSAKERPLTALERVRLFRARKNNQQSSNTLDIKISSNQDIEMDQAVPQSQLIMNNSITNQVDVNIKQCKFLSFYNLKILLSNI